MKHFSNAICVVDTCAILNLDGIRLGTMDVLEHMRRHFGIHVCSDVLGELRRHREDLESREASYWPRFLTGKVCHPLTLVDDDTVLGVFYCGSRGACSVAGAGERGNARVAIELLLTRQAGHAVFVTDDRNARNFFLSRLAEDFPGVHLWSSVDLVLYMGAILMKEKKACYKDVDAALRDVVPGSGHNTYEGDSTSAVIKRLRTAHESLNRVWHTAKCWR